MSGVDQNDRQRKGGREDDHKSRRSHSGNYNGSSSHSGDSKHRSQQESYDQRKAQEQEYYRQQQKQQQQQQQQQQPQYKSGHMEVNSLYSGDTGPIKVNAMNAPENSTLQCGCENIDCPFCNQMISISMSGQ